MSRPISLIIVIQLLNAIIIPFNSLKADNDLRLRGLLREQLRYTEKFSPVSAFFSLNTLHAPAILPDSTHFLFILNQSFHGIPSNEKRLFLDSPLIVGFPSFSSVIKINDNLNVFGQFNAFPYRKDNVLLSGFGILLFQQAEKNLLQYSFEIRHLKGPDDFRLNIISLSMEYYHTLGNGMYFLGLTYQDIQYRLRDIFPIRQFEQFLFLPSLGYTRNRENGFYYAWRFGAGKSIISLNISGGYFIP